jgi:hypothetical protein
MSLKNLGSFTAVDTANFIVVSDKFFPSVYLFFPAL